MVSPQFSELVIRQYPEQHYSVLFNQRTGFLARVEEHGYKEPFWSWHGPELLDIAITNWCDRECVMCYRSSSRFGKHMSVSDYENIMQQARELHVFQVALGGGNPNQHPDFCRILKLTREKYDIVPSYTTNGRGLTEEVLKASRAYCGAVAVSAYNPFEEMIDAIDALTRYGIKVNIHFVLDSTSVEIALRWLETPPSFLDSVNAVVFLNYKPVGRFRDRAFLLKHSDKVEQFFAAATSRRPPFRVGFDSCLASGLARFTNVSRTFFDGCDAARFSMFVSEEMNMYPCSFLVADHEGVPFTNDNMLEAWRTGELFKQTRGRLLASRCRMCVDANVCLGGCPVFRDINLCYEGNKTS